MRHSVLLSALALSLALSHSVRADSYIDDLTTRRDTLQKNDNYKHYIENMFRAEIFTYFSGRFRDTVHVTQELSNQASAAIDRARKNHATVALLGPKALASDPAQAQIDARDLAMMMWRLDSDAEALAKIAADYKELYSYWDTRCQLDHLSYARSYFQPGNLYQANQMQFKSPNRVLTIGFQLPIDFSGSISHPLQVKTAADGAIYAGSTAAAAAVGDTSAAAPVADFLITIKDFFVGLHEYNETKDLITDIALIQNDSIYGINADGEIQGMCSKSEPDSISGNTTLKDTFGLNATTVNAFAIEARSYADAARNEFSILEAKTELNLKKLIDTDIDSEVASYETARAAAVEALNDVDQKMTSRLDDIATLDAKLDAGGGSARQVAVADTLWTKLIEGDAMYLSVGAGEDDQVWSMMKDIVKAKVAP